MADSKKPITPKQRKAKSSSAEAFRKFLNKRVDIIEEEDSEPEDAGNSAGHSCKVVTPVKEKKEKKKPDALQDRYDQLVRQLEVIQQNQEMLYQKQTKLKKRVKAKPMTDTPRPSQASSPDITMARRQALLRF